MIFGSMDQYVVHGNGDNGHGARYDTKINHPAWKGKGRKEGGGIWKKEWIQQKGSRIRFDEVRR